MEISEEFKLRDIVQDNWAVFFKSVNVMENKEKENRRNCHILEETRDMTTKCMWEPGPEKVS